jgi:hypothetical protein
MKEFDKIYLSWRPGQSQRRLIVGVIEELSSGKYVFQYLQDKVTEAKKHGFSPYTEFPDVEKSYNGNVVDVFAQRLTKAERSDVQKFYDFWEVDPKFKDDKFYLLGQTQGLTPTDNFEFLAERNPVEGLHFLTEVAGLSHYQLPRDTVRPGDELRYAFDKSNEHDTEAVKVFKGDREIGYIKKIHCRVFSKPGAENLKLAVKAVEQNGIIKRVFVKVSK